MRTFRHAVALDERRAKFKVNLWNRPNNKEEKLGVTGQKTKSEKDHARPKPVRTGSQNKLRAMERQYSKQSDRKTDIEEVCFVHGFLF